MDPLITSYLISLLAGETNTFLGSVKTKAVAVQIEEARKKSLQDFYPNPQVRKNNKFRFKKAFDKLKKGINSDEIEHISKEEEKFLELFYNRLMEQPVAWNYVISIYQKKQGQNIDVILSTIRSSKKEITEKIDQVSKTDKNTESKDEAEMLLFDSHFYDRFSDEYVGRDESIKEVIGFFENSSRHFLLLFGVGGMGKSHLISECRKVLKGKHIIHCECHDGYNIKSLFRICRIDYPDDLHKMKDIQNLFLEEFCKKELTLILDDFYEIVDADIREMLPKFARIPRGKILAISRTIPKEISQTGVSFDKYEIPPLNYVNFSIVLHNYVNKNEKFVSLNNKSLRKIFHKTGGYPLGGKLIIDLMEIEENLDNIIDNIPTFQADRDPEGKDFSGRLLDNIFQKGDQKEIKLLCEFSALFGASSLETIKMLPSYKFESFEKLVRRRRFIQKDENNLFHSHAMIKDFSYEKLHDKETIHEHCAKLFEEKLYKKGLINSEHFQSATNHYKRVSQKEFRKFGFRVGRKFNIKNIKFFIQKETIDTIRNYRSLILIYPEKVAYYNELGIAYRENNQKQLAIEIFKKVIEEIDPENIHSYNELGIIYRENNQKQLAIETFKKIIEDIDPKNAHSYNELGITYRENNQRQLAIETFKKAIEEIDSEHVHSYNELGITYRENNQRQLAIKVFKKVIEKIDPENVHSYNELGITYREDNQIGQAIQIFEKGLEIDPENKFFLLSLIQIYLFFSPSRTKAKIFYNKLVSIKPHLKSFKNSKRHYAKIIENIDEIWNLTVQDLRIYYKYCFLSIQNKSYHKIINLLLDLVDKYPEDAKLLSKLGRTLANEVISRGEEGEKFLLKSLILYQNAGNKVMMVENIFHYLYVILNNKKLIFFEAELKKYTTFIQNTPGYYRLLGKYYISINKREIVIIEAFTNAINISRTKEELRCSNMVLLEFLISLNDSKFEAKIIKLKHSI